MRSILAVTVVIALASQADAQCTCGYPHSCTTPCERCAPSCTCPPSNRQLPPQQPPTDRSFDERGAFAAPPRTGTTAGESRALGVEGLGIHIPAMSLRLPTITLPTFVRHRREARLMIDAQEAPFVRDTMRELTIPRGNDRELTDRGISGGDRDLPGQDRSVPCDRGLPSNERGLPCDRGLPAGCTGAGGVEPQGSALAPMPPAPRAVRAVAHPDLGALPQGQYLQDPATGRIYQVVLQPMAVATQPVMVEQPAGQQPDVRPEAQPSYYAAPPAAFAEVAPPAASATTDGYGAPQFQRLPAVEAYAASEPHTQLVSATMPAGSREVELSQALSATQQRADELEGHVRRLEGMVERLARQQAVTSGMPGAPPPPAADHALQAPQPLPAADATPVVLENAPESPSVGGKLRSWFVRK